jgi:hypothetical protein
MKQLYTVIVSTLLLSPAIGQLSIGGGYQMSLPLEEMRTNINPTHSFSMAGIHQLRNFPQLSLGFEAGLGTYAQKNMDQTFVFRDGSRTTTNVNYSSNMWQAAALVRFDLVKKAKLTPYLSGKLGYHRLYANIRVDDPNDVDGCRPLDRRSLMGDGTMTMGGGLGFKVDMALFSRGGWDKGMGWFDLSVNYITGGNVSYINTRKLSSATAVPGNGGEAVNMQFINANTGNIHQHQVAQVFTSPLRMLQIQLSFFKGF